MQPYPGRCFAQEQQRGSPAALLRSSQVIGALVIVLALLLAATLNAGAASLAPICSDFEDLTVGATYNVGAGFTSGPHNYQVRKFFFSDGTDTSNGFVEVEDNQTAGGSGNDLEVNNSTLELVLPMPVQGVRFNAGWLGGNVNLWVNGDFRNAAALTDLNGQVVGGATVSLTANGANRWIVEIQGLVDQFAIGGQELFVDNLCVLPKENPPDDGNNPEGAPDLGDAPDSTNHHGIANSAYPAVPGQFPTVWQDPTGAPSGPRHANLTREAILGNHLSREAEADNGPDGDGLNNILNGGGDNANNDDYDDGWRNRGVSILDCRPTHLVVRVSKAAAATRTKMYLNVWFDGNTDGDWQDGKSCRHPETGFQYRAVEWIVQDYVVDLTAIPAGGYVDISVPTLPVLFDAAPERNPWMRFTLSERPAVRSSATSLADGRGPQHPNQYEHGETEDVRYRAASQGEPGTVTLRKRVETPAQPVLPGSLVTYTIEVAHQGGTAAAQVALSDTLPAGVTLAGRVVAREVSPHVSTLAAEVDGQLIRWRGALSPGAALRIHIPVRVDTCIDPAGQPKTITNTVRARWEGGLLSEQADFTAHCVALSLDDLDVSANLVTSDSDAISAALAVDPTDPSGNTYLMDEEGLHYLRVKVDIRNNGPYTTTVRLGLQAKQVMESAANRSPYDKEARAIVPPGRTVTVYLGVTVDGSNKALLDLIRADDEPVHSLVLTYCLNDGQGPCAQSDPNQPSAQIALWIRRYTKDLGDAPDSTNHFATAMLAYPAVQANFPTVFDPATGVERGPRHRHPRPFHLGALVSWEREADLAPDQDLVTNIMPWVAGGGQSNLDRHDDGANPPVWTLEHCRRTLIPIQVSISPVAVAYFQQTQTKGYINIWLDSNRDGDWADAAQCPSAENLPPVALEHIVIDHEVDVVALGAGLHTIQVPTGRVPWANTEQPAWVRVTLSERPSNKPLTTAGIAHGDGRGHDQSFRLGETEDYLWRPANNPGGIDVVVHKQGRVYQEYDAAQGQVVNRIAWAIEYGNRGDRTAENVILRDQLEEGQNIIAVLIGLVMPEGVTRQDEGDTLVFHLGDLEPGERGRIVIITNVTQEFTQLQTLANRAQIRAEGDVDTSNNLARAVVHVGLRAPRILTPVDGTACADELEVVGRAEPNATVELFVDGNVQEVVTANERGVWRATLNLDAGDHTLYAVASVGGITSPPSETVEITVDPSLPWSPITLRFTDPRSHVHQPVDDKGRLDASGWSLQLKPNTLYTTTVKVCCDASAALVVLVVGEDTVVLTDPDGDGIYSGSFTTGPRSETPGAMTLVVLCGETQAAGSGDVTLIDPAGTVYDINSGQPLDQATVACMEGEVSSAGGAAVFSLWDAAAYGQTNPQQTQADGAFSFLTPAGVYQLNVSRAGYQPYRSPALLVESEPVYYDVPLTPAIEQEADYRITITEFGFEPAVLVAPAGAVVEWVNADTQEHSATFLPDAAQAAGQQVTGWDSGVLAPGESYKVRLGDAGSYTYGDRLNGQNSGIIMVEAQESQSLYLPALQK